MLGAMQARTPNDPRWYNPERDMIWAFPRLISRALRNLPDLGPEQEAKVGEVAKQLAQLINRIRDAKIAEDQVLVEVKKLDPEGLLHIQQAFFFSVMGELYHWCGCIEPRPGEKDQPLDLKELDHAVGRFCRDATGPAGGNHAAPVQ